MNHIPHVLDTVLVGTLAALTAAAPLLVNDPTIPAADVVEMKLFLLPSLGALVVSGGMIMLNPEPEVRRIVIGRSIFALFFGVLVPQVVGMFHPALQTASVKPAVLALMGGGIAGLTYVLSKPFCREFYLRADGIAKRKAAELEAKYTSASAAKNDAP